MQSGLIIIRCCGWEAEVVGGLDGMEICGDWRLGE